MCPYCGLPQDQVDTLGPGPVLLEPVWRPLAHRVPPERRWIGISRGRVTVYGVCPPVAEQRCRIEHALVCPGQPLPGLWPELTKMREVNAQKAARRKDKPALPGGEQLRDVG
ncbi:DUF6083 domain-containing protein [Streptomyces sp. NPDC051214]|uniref:DUF6083 domain-containing protein n=1 Tax=Streptomyces sp. NPDC051214 TaxID=3155282 RepID=UPI0034379B46